MLLYKLVRSVLGKYWSSSFSASLWTEPQKFLLSWLYFEFLDGTAYFIGDNARATISRENLFLSRHLPRTSAKAFWQDNEKRFLLNVKMFPFEYLFKNTNQCMKSVSERSICEVRIAKFGPLRKPIILLFTLDQFSHIINK